MWSSIPDDALLRAAEAGLLSDPAELERQVRRMLADPRAGALTRNFAGQWLQLRNLADPAVRPGDPYSLAFDESLRRGMIRDGGSVAARLADMRKDRSILDATTESLRRLERRLGVGDRTRVDKYLDTVRDVERRIQRAEENNASTPLPELEQPAGVPDGYAEHLSLLYDLLALAFQADVTRVSCTQVAREQSGRTYPEIGVPEAHHTVSHHQTDPHNVAQYTKINVFQMSLFAKLVEKLRATPDGDGTLLDHCILVYGCGMGDGDHHTPFDLPVALVGGGAGRLAGNRHLKYPLHTPFMNLGLSLLEKVDVEVERIADSTGRLAGV